jgi:uncharacterized membrane protein YvbJ
MALIKCSECGKEISDKASTCPNCGNPIKQSQVLVQMDTAPQKRRKYKIYLLITFPMVLFGPMFYIMSLLSGKGSIFWFLVGLIGFIGMIISSIGYWLSKP